MKREDFKDLTPIELQMKRDPTLKITDAMWVKFTSDDPSSVQIRRSHNVLQPWNRHSMLKLRRGALPSNLPKPPELTDLPSLYQEPLPVKKEKRI